MKALRTAQAQSIAKKAKLKKYLTKKEEPVILAAAPPVREHRPPSQEGIHANDYN